MRFRFVEKRGLSLINSPPLSVNAEIMLQFKYFSTDALKHTKVENTSDLNIKG